MNLQNSSLGRSDEFMEAVTNLSKDLYWSVIDSFAQKEFVGSLDGDVACFSVRTDLFRQKGKQLKIPMLPNVLFHTFDKLFHTFGELSVRADLFEKKATQPKNAFCSFYLLPLSVFHHFAANIVH